jgi:hypothetical protein
MREGFACLASQGTRAAVLEGLSSALRKKVAQQPGLCSAMRLFGMQAVAATLAELCKRIAPKPPHRRRVICAIGMRAV